MYKVRTAERDREYGENSPSKVVTMGNVTEVTTFLVKPVGPPIRKLTNDLYEDLRTGLVFEYDHIQNRAQSLDGIRRTLARIRALINTNVTDPEKCRWVTLTYAENMTDTKRLYEDYKKFWARFKYWCQRNGVAVPEYISVIEPQGRGAWHVHAFLIWNEKAPFIGNNEVTAKLWGQGFTSTKALGDVDNVGAYFSAYLADMPLEEVERLPDRERLQAMAGCADVIEKEFTNAEDMTKKKKFVKGGRLYLYPPKMNIVRKSAGIKDPIIEEMTAKEAKEKISCAELTFSKAYEVVRDDGKVVNALRKDYYNSKRRKKASPNDAST